MEEAREDKKENLHLLFIIKAVMLRIIKHRQKEIIRVSSMTTSISTSHSKFNILFQKKATNKRVDICQVLD